MRVVIACLVSSVLGASFTLWFVHSPSVSEARAQEAAPPVLTAPGVTPAAPPVDGLSQEELINVFVYEKNNRAVVNITTKTLRTDGFFLLEGSSEGTGSGFVLDERGHVVTNYHVLEGAQEVAVTLYNGKTYPAERVGTDAINDLAVIRIDADDEVLHPAEFGDSGVLRVGMRVFAIGNPFGLERTMTTGIISSLNRSLQVRANRTIRSIIQIDAAVNPGNSGGPLLNTQGQVIGINTAIATKTGQSAGVGFAIPANLASRVVRQLIQFGRVIRPEIGIQRVYETDEGLLIAQLTPNGPAEKAGLRGPLRQRRGPFLIVDRSAADLIVRVDQVEVRTADDFMTYIEGKRAGDVVTLTIVRGGRTVKIPVELGGERPE